MDILKNIIALKQSDSQDHTLFLDILDQLSQYTKLYKKFPLDHPIIQKRCPLLIDENIVTRRFLFILQNILTAYLPEGFPQLVQPSRSEIRTYQNGIPIFHDESPLSLDIEENLLVAYHFDNTHYAFFYFINNAYRVLTATINEDLEDSQPSNQSIPVDYQGDTTFTLLVYSTHGYNQFPIATYCGKSVLLPKEDVIQIGNQLYDLTPDQVSSLATTMYDADLFKEALLNVLKTKEGDPHETAH